MAIVAGIEAIAIVLIVYATTRYLRLAEERWMRERRELLNRIQHPEVIPREEPQVFEVPEQEPDNSHLVGTIHIDPDYEGFS